MPIPSGLPQAREAGMWNPKRKTEERDMGLSASNNPEDRIDWNSDDEAFDEFGRKKSSKKRRKEDTRSTSKLSSKAPKPQSTAPASIQAVLDVVQRTQLPARASASASSKATLNEEHPLAQRSRIADAAAGLAPDKQAELRQALQAKFTTASRPADNLPVTQAAVMAARRGAPLPPVRKSAREAAMEVAEKTDTHWKKDKWGANTGANMIHLRKQWKPIVPCKYYIEGTCKSGSSCTFLHERPELCKFLVNGQCMKGASCDLYHPPVEESTPTPSASFTDFETGDPTSGLDFASSGQTLMEKLWKDNAEAAAEKKRIAYADAASGQRKPIGVQPKASSQDKTSASHGSSWRGQWQEAPAVQESWGWQQAQRDERPVSQPARMKQTTQDAADYWGGLATPAKQFEGFPMGAAKSAPVVLKSVPVVPQSIPVVPYGELSDEEIQSRLQLAREKAIEDSDAGHFCRVADSLIEYIDDEEIATAKKFVQDEIKAKTNIVSMNDNLQNLGRVRK